MTGGSSRIWGLGYELFPCTRLSTACTKPSFPPSSSVFVNRRVTFTEPDPPPQGSSTSAPPEPVIGLGHCDLGGSVAFCIPQMNLSIAILLNDILVGPPAARQIIEFVLSCFGLRPGWTVRYTLEDALNDAEATVRSYAVSQTSSAVAALKKEQGFMPVSPPS